MDVLMQILLQLRQQPIGLLVGGAGVVGNRVIVGGFAQGAEKFTRGFMLAYDFVRKPRCLARRFTALNESREQKGFFLDEVLFEVHSEPPVERVHIIEFPMVRAMRLQNPR